jgi:hypothetical protein
MNRCRSRLGPFRLPLAAGAGAALVLAAGVCGATDFAGGLNPAPDPQHPVTVPIGRVTTALSKEAHEVWDRQQPWPRTQPDLAQKQALRVSNDDLVLVLSRRLDSSPAIDAYMKWQLLSFQPDLAQQKAELCRRIIGAMPEVRAQPEPELPESEPATGGMTIGAQRTIVSGMQPVPGTHVSRPILSTIGAGAGLGNTGSANDYDLGRAQQDLAVGQVAAQRVNVTVLAYRDALIQRLPRAGGLRVAAMLADLKSRIICGEPSVPAAAQRLLAECQDPGPALPLSPDWHGPILGVLRELLNLRVAVTSKIGVNDRGVLTLERHDVFVPPDTVLVMVRSLNLAEELVPKP